MRLCCSLNPVWFRTMTRDFQVPFEGLEQDSVKTDRKVPQSLLSLGL
jgi:hypothetical protein